MTNLVGLALVVLSVTARTNMAERAEHAALPELCYYGHAVDAAGKWHGVGPAVTATVYEATGRTTNVAVSVTYTVRLGTAAIWKAPVTIRYEANDPRNSYVREIPGIDKPEQELLVVERTEPLKQPKLDTKTHRWF